MISGGKRANTELSKEGPGVLSGSREGVAVFNELIRLGFIEKWQKSEKKVGEGQEISYMWGEYST